MNPNIYMLFYDTTIAEVRENASHVEPSKNGSILAQFWRHNSSFVFRVARVNVTGKNVQNLKTRRFGVPVRVI